MTRLRSEDGFTLMELIMAMAVGFVLLGATLGLLESSVKLNTGVMAKTDAMQRGRLAMDTVTQQLRSQVCLDWDNSAVRAGSDEYAVTFFADFSAGDLKPVKRTLGYNAATRSILIERTDPPTPLPDPLVPDSYGTSPDSASLVLENAVLEYDQVAMKNVPFLRYYAYEQAADGVMRPQLELSPPLDEAEAARVARIEINFISLPTGSSDGSKGVLLTDQVMARHADPNLAVPDPNCV
jgi:prepilin-type N-terminal cleavage/methylation domain-containing protein